MSFKNIALLLCCVLVGLYIAYTINLSKQARQIMAYSNPNVKASLQAVKRNPDDAAAHMSLAHYYLTHSLKEKPKMLHELQEVVRIEPNNGEAKWMLAYELNWFGRKEESLKIYRELAKQDDRWGQAARKRLQRLSSKRASGAK